MGGGGALLQAALAPGKPDQERENLVTRHGSPNGVHAAAFQMTRSDTELNVCTRAPWDRSACCPIRGRTAGAGKGSSRPSVLFRGRCRRQLGRELTRIPRHDTCSVRFSGRAECVRA